MLNDKECQAGAGFVSVNRLDMYLSALKRQAWRWLLWNNFYSGAKEAAEVPRPQHSQHNTYRTLQHLQDVIPRLLCHPVRQWYWGRIFRWVTGDGGSFFKWVTGLVMDSPGETLITIWVVGFRVDSPGKTFTSVDVNSAVETLTDVRVGFGWLTGVWEGSWGEGLTCWGRFCRWSIHSYWGRFRWVAGVKFLKCVTDVGVDSTGEWHFLG